VNTPKPTIGRHVTPRSSKLLRDHEGLRMAFEQNVKCVGQSSASVSPDRHLEPGGRDDRRRGLMLLEERDVSWT
jgi:hypothetical protein